METIRRILEVIRAIVTTLLRGGLFCDVDWSYD